MRISFFFDRGNYCLFRSLEKMSFNLRLVRRMEAVQQLDQAAAVRVNTAKRDVKKGEFFGDFF